MAPGSWYKHKNVPRAGCYRCCVTLMGNRRLRLRRPHLVWLLARIPQTQPDYFQFSSEKQWLQTQSHSMRWFRYLAWNGGFQLRAAMLPSHHHRWYIIPGVFNNQTNNRHCQYLRETRDIWDDLWCLKHTCALFCVLTSPQKSAVIYLQPSQLPFHQSIIP